MWVDRDNFEIMERDINKLKNHMDSLYDRVISMKRITENVVDLKKHMRDPSKDPYRFHDLRKDPTDLPENYGQDWVMVKVECTGMDGKPLIAEHRNGKWFSDGDREVELDNWSKVIGWFNIYDPCLRSDGEEVK